MTNNKPNKLITKKSLTILVTTIFLLLSYKIITTEKFHTDNLTPEKYIAHAGGYTKGEEYTNSLEAIEESYRKKFTFFELDFSWTTDNELVLIHDWEVISRFFNEENKQYSLAEFKKFKMVQGLTQLTLYGLVLWLQKHPDTHIITDFKVRNIEGLRLISQKYPSIVHQIIPQIYSFDEYNDVRNLGYEDIILTLYQSPFPAEQLIRFAKRNKLLAIAMSISKAFNTDLPRKLNDIGVFVYCHTDEIEDIMEKFGANNMDELMKKLAPIKVNGFYTPYLERPLLDKKHLSK
jgi:glycerophosphoryl diester phosphodiesterase